MKTVVVGFWERVTRAFGTEQASEIARKLGLTYNAVRKWRKGEVPGLDTLLAIKTLTGSSLDWLLTGDEKTIEHQTTLEYSEARIAEPETAYNTASVDTVILRLIEARVAPLEKEIRELKSMLQEKL